MTGTAIAMMDVSYMPVVMFADGQATTTLTMTPVQDSNVEGTETIICTISSSAWYDIGSPGSATMYLYDDDTVQVSVAKQGGDPTEGGNGTFRITRTGSTSGNLTVNFTTGGTATSGTDYTSIGTSATITGGNSYVDVTVATLPDNLVEGSETATIAITDNGSTYSAYGSSAEASMSIVDDPPIISIAATDTTEGENGKFRISRTGGKTSDSVTVYYTVTGGTADSGDDFTALSGSVVIGGGNSYANVTLTALPDNLIEGDETVEVTISSGGSNYTIAGSGGGVATLIITDDPPVVSIARLSDGEEGGSDGVFRVSRTGGDITEAFVVTYTVGGDATGDGDEDYDELSGTVTIAANNSYADITIDVVNDNDEESTETVIVTLDSSEDFLLGSESDTLFIWDNDLDSFTWTGAEDDNWMNADNWLENAIPGAEDAVFFTGSYTTDARLYGPLSPYSIRELRISSSYTGTLTLSNPLSVGSLKLDGGTIDQPSSAYGSGLTITEKALWTAGVLNSTANLATVAFVNASVLIDSTGGLTSGSQMTFEDCAATAAGGTTTFTNGETVLVSGTTAMTILGWTVAITSTSGPLTVDGATVNIIGNSTIHSISVIHSGIVNMSSGNNAISTVTITGGGANGVTVDGGTLNLQHGTTLDAGSNWVSINGWDDPNPAPGG